VRYSKTNKQGRNIVKKHKAKSVCQICKNSERIKGEKMSKVIGGKRDQNWVVRLGT